MKKIPPSGDMKTAVSQTPGEETWPDFGIRVKRMRKRLGMSQEDLAQKTGVSKGTIQNMEKGALPKGENLIGLHRALGVSTDWLLLGTGTPDPRPGFYDPPSPEVSQISETYLTRETSPEPMVVLPPPQELDSEGMYHYFLVPLVETQLGAGGGVFVESEKISKLMAFRLDWLKDYATSTKNLVLMFVRGNSMEPTILDGDMVMLDTGRRQIHNGSMYAIGIGDAILVKRLEKLLSGRIRVLSENPDFSTDEVDSADLRILGQIVWFARELIR